MDSMLAIHSASEVNEKKRVLAKTWEHFITKNRKPQHIRPSIYQSWMRCQQYGVDPHQKQSVIALPQDELTEILHKSKLYQVSQPVLKELDYMIRNTQHLITLCDKNGRIIYLQGDSHILSKAEEMNFVQGADWSEKAAGSNAIGTCIATEMPIQVFAYEHYCIGAHPWICSAAPIKDPLTNELLGVFDLTGPSEFGQPHTLGLAQNIAALIQQNLATISHAHRQHLLDCYHDVVRRWNSNSTLALDVMLNFVTAGSSCLSLLKIKDWKQIWMHPELADLKKTLLNSNEKEQEIYLPSLELYVYIRCVSFQSERIGFILHLEKKREHQPLNAHLSMVQANQPNPWANLIGRSASFQRVIQKAQIAAPTNVPILITGESGTGKEQLARAIHQGSMRHDGPFIAVNCGAIPKELIASELFGYEPGTFTGGDPKGKKGKFEEANGGTLLLDEIGEMPLELQVHLLRVLQEREVTRLGASRPTPIDVRVIAATNQNINVLIDQRKFRTDLYFRLNVVELKLPPLRERKEDIPSMANHFAAKSASKLGKPVPEIDDSVLAYFHSYPWPGNIRELENTIEYAVLFCQDNRITISSLPESLLMRNKNHPHPKTVDKLSPLDQEEKLKLMQLIQETNHNLSEVARRCGIARTTLYRKLKKYNLK